VISLALLLSYPCPTPVSRISYTVTVGADVVSILGSGRVGPPTSERELEKPKYIQPHETERLLGLGKTVLVIAA